METSSVTLACKIFRALDTASLGCYENLDSDQVLDSTYCLSLNGTGSTTPALFILRHIKQRPNWDHGHKACLEISELGCARGVICIPVSNPCRRI